MGPIPGTLRHFAGLTLDREQGCLRRGAVEIELRPKTFAVLCYLADRPGRVVGKGELFAALWPGVTVTDDSLVQCITELRRALADHEQRLIRTVPRRGYRLVATVPEEARDAAPSGPGAARIRERWLASLSPLARGMVLASGAILIPWLLWLTAAGVVGTPSVAVLPFDAGEGDALCERFADGVMELTLTELAALQHLDVTAGSSAKVYADKAVDARQIGRELAVRYLIEGAVRCDSRRVRVTARLIDAGSGRLAWAESWDRPMADPFAVQAELAGEVAKRMRDSRLFAHVDGGAAGRR